MSFLPQCMYSQFSPCVRGFVPVGEHVYYVYTLPNSSLRVLFFFFTTRWARFDCRVLEVRFDIWWLARDLLYPLIGCQHSCSLHGITRTEKQRDKWMEWRRLNKYIKQEGKRMRVGEKAGDKDEEEDGKVKSPTYEERQWIRVVISPSATA